MVGDIDGLDWNRNIDGQNKQDRKEIKGGRAGD
jgi:hypothetical protein